MNKRQKTYTALACACAAAIVLSALLLGSRGVPAADLSAYAEPSRAAASATAEAVALAYLDGDADPVEGMGLVAKDGGMSLYYNEKTTEIAVRDVNGRIWYSNPPGRVEDSLASGYEKESLASQLSVQFRDSVGTNQIYTNYARSISGGQFKAASIEGGIRIEYTLGDTSLGINALPRLISRKRLEEKVVSRLEPALAKYVSARYYASEANPEVLERLDGQISKKLVLDKMVDAFEKAGYAADDLAADNAENGIGDGEGSDKPSFTIPVEYRLDRGSLLVTVPLGQLQESGPFRLRSLDLLSYFGAADDKAEGYMLVPDGSGSLINLNNGKVAQEQYVQRVYGSDRNDNSRTRGQVSEDAKLPVFGMKSGDGGWFAVIEKGDAIASIAADIGGRQSSYNHVFGSFALRGEDELEMYTGQKMQEIQLLSEERYRGDVEIRYSFLGGAEASYSGMARLYQRQLEERGALRRLDGESPLPFFLDVIGTVDKRASLAGVPYRETTALTTFKQAGEMHSLLRENGVTAVQMRYLGWFGGGVNHHSPSSVRIDSEAGSAAGLRSLAKQLDGGGGMLFPDVAFQTAYKNDRGFAPASDAARFVTKEQAKLYPYNPALSRMDSTKPAYYLLSPAKLPYYVGEFSSDYGKLGIGSLSLRDLGGELAADYRDSRPVFRETAKAIAKEQLGKLKLAYPQLLIQSPNAYALPFSSRLVGVPSGSSGFTLTDEAIPFYQMVLHGYADYAGEPMNRSGDSDLRLQLLKSLELGAAPRFEWSWLPSSALKLTDFEQLYSTGYEAWLADAAELYKEADKVLGPLRGVRIKSHEIIKEGLVLVSYENGAWVAVNYTKRSATVGGVTIEPESYATGGTAG
ncbi:MULTISPECIES: DUF5696 domain-containing protein [unclassified Paenibacillus]|uniref:DUF5696 domain-containing protein n=1 Tax=unclassified Paenibacillus TaxID=185978 RepID=UPI0009570B62|nr:MULTISPECIES: DUF5696 domain-containing protein [unclassified Paenibacillus]ASS64776.1 hypothetical protein CIC07_00630 [Paenibacillus sp. RUD330]SIR06407.1 hypothetical protein SAMN05880555_2933 [Paenibacillus sp. RU4X]SIR29127.1 hypothetical protein SAMN05880570_3067 [Paenibacillus sp. RU4T]